MKQTNTLIIGASISGLATAASLQKKNIEFIIIEKQNQPAASWHRHYDRLHLHTNKRNSHLPYIKFRPAIPRYPDKQQVIEYLRDYQKEFNIIPLVNVEALSVKRDGAFWITDTNDGQFRSKYLVMATGAYGKPKSIHIKGMESFPGRILHSCEYKTGNSFKGQNVLVIGFGNSACEIAIDLYEQGCMPSMSVRSPVNVVPRDLLGIPILELSLILNNLPPRVADIIGAPLIRSSIGNLTKLGLKKLPYGPLEQIHRDGTAPVLDIGTIEHIREGHIKIYPEIDFIEGRVIYFKDGIKREFDSIVAGIGYHRDYPGIMEVDKSRFEDLELPMEKQKYFGKDGLYFCGFWISPTGQIREISSDAQKVAKDIEQAEQSAVQ